MVARLIILVQDFVAKPLVAMTLKDAKGEDIYITNTYYQNIEMPELTPGTLLNISFTQELLVCPGDYFISFVLSLWIAIKLFPLTADTMQFS